MKHAPNLSSKFRILLKAELHSWVEQGLVTEENAARLGSIYQLDELGRESSRLLAAVLFTLGSLLVGGSAISFVAAHWSRIAPWPRVGLLFAALMAFYLGGYWLRLKCNWPRLGHALIFCGCLVFGANIGLMAQVFQVSGEWYGLFGLWALGALAMGWAIRSWIIGVLALVTSFAWFVGFADDGHQRLSTIYPFMLVASLVPLAWMIRSRVLYTAAFLGFIYSLLIVALFQFDSNRFSLLALAMGGFVTWAVGEYHRSTGVRPEFSNPVSYLGLLTLAGSAYFWSFHWVWEWGKSVRPNFSYWLIPAVLAMLLGIVLLWRSWPRMGQPQRRYLIGAAAVLLLLCLSTLLNRLGQIPPTIANNIAAIVVAGVCIGKGIVEEHRLTFWAGALFLTTVILTRFFEYETSLLTKSLAFLLCGLVTILAGIGYERYLLRKEAVAR